MLAKSFSRFVEPVIFALWSRTRYSRFFPYNLLNLLNRLGRQTFFTHIPITKSRPSGGPELICFNLVYLAYLTRKVMKAHLKSGFHWNATEVPSE